MDCNWITLWWHKQICIPKVAIPTHWELQSIIGSHLIQRRALIGFAQEWSDKYECIVKQESNSLPPPLPSLYRSLPSPFALWSRDNILIDIYEGHWLIISNSSPLITHHWCYVHAYLLETPIGSTAFLMQIGRQLSSPSVMETEEAGLVCS